MIEPHAIDPQAGQPQARDERSPALSLRGISKWYGHLRASRNVDFDAYAGEIVALVGDNGAGKSTLVKMMSGVLRPDEGTISVEGRRYDFKSPRDAQAAGVSTVFQDLALVEALDVGRNMFLGSEPSRFGFVNRRKLYAETRRLFESLEINLPSVKSPIGSLSGGQRQGVALARSVLHGGPVLILDEPTAALGVRETARVLDIVTRLKEQGKAVVFVSHDLELVLAATDRIHVVRLGQTAGVVRTADTNRRDLVNLITGGSIAMAHELNPSIGDVR